MTSNSSDKYKAPALEKGLQILEFLALQATAQSQSEIALGLYRSPNEIYRMLASLESNGYIHRDPISSKYSLSLKLYYLSHRHSFVEKLRATSLLPMQDTSNEIKDPCHLCVIYDNQVMVIAYARGSSPISIVVEEGKLYSTSQTASGKLLLSFSETEKRKSILEADPYYCSLKKAERQQFDSDLADIKRKGFYEMPSAYAEGIIDISVPIGTSETGIIACLTVSKLVRRQTGQNMPTEAIVDSLKKCRSQIESNLGLT
ncbi:MULTISPECIES: IclR family transcriptional regulator [Sphingobacterium]|uniref:IclR family transcriptional regulator n=1 Tax=Sphingobacterium TaxID=28453 RepID=UPI00257E200E|nr:MULTISPECIES: helix-turn-helix domain-containing protein [Sphingobacterium]